MFTNKTDFISCVIWINFYKSSHIYAHTLGLGHVYQANPLCPCYNYYTHMHACTRTLTHTYTHTHIHTHTRIHTRTHTHIQLLASYSYVSGISRECKSVSLIVSNKLDFNPCAIWDSFHTSSYKCFIAKISCLDCKTLLGLSKS